MADDDYERRMKMTEGQKMKEAAGKMLKGLFGSGDKAAAKQPAPKPDSNIDRMKEKQKALRELTEYKKGGKVPKTGPAKLHKGERVLTTRQTKKLEAKPAIKKAIGLKTVKPAVKKAVGLKTKKR